MNDLTFASPAWFWGLLVLLPLLGLRLWSDLARSRQLPGLVSPRLHHRLVNGSGRLQRWTVFACQCLALALVIGALARPQYGYEEIEAEAEARNLIIAIDTSRSMLANDLAPDRLSRAKLAATDIVRSMPEDRVGLIAFAGRPFLQAPLTVDHEAILESIDQLDTEIIPRGGTNLSAAADLALKTFAEAEVEQSSLVIFSDGEALEGAAELESVRDRASAAGMSIIAVGVGTASGAIIPELDDHGNPVPGVFVKDDTGQVVRSRLDASALQALSKSGGIYVHLGGRDSLTRVAELIRRGIATTREESEARLRPLERFPWPLSGAFLLLVTGHLVPLLWLKPRTQAFPFATREAVSPGVLPLLLAAAFIGAVPAMADDPLFSGHESFRERDFEGAIETYEGAIADTSSKRDRSRLHLGIGAAAFRLGDFERAARAYGDALVGSPKDTRAIAHYNLGNTLFRQGEAGLKNLQSPGNPDQLQDLSAPDQAVEATIERWESAIEHYESALGLNEKDEKAAHNIEVVRKRLEELQKEQEEKQEQEQEQQKEEKDQEQEEEEKEKEKEQEKEEKEQENQDQKQENQDQEQDKDGEEKEDGEQENEQEQPEDQPQDPGEEEKSDEGDSSEQDGEQEPQPEGQQPDPSEGQPDAPQDGDLEANPNEEQPAQPQAANPQQMQRNPETGYSPSEARQLLEALADETEVRPILRPSGGERYKNW